MTIKLDHSVEAVMNFMERNVEADRLVRVAMAVASLAPTVWGDQVPLGRDRLIKFTPESSHEQLSTAIQLDPVRECAGDGSEAGMDNRQLT